jgi:hypothetical protein
VRYDSGLTLWVNWRNEPWLVEGRRLPQWGFLARGPGTLATTELRGEHVADYAECPEFIFVDARTDPAVTGVKPTPADRPARDPVRPTPGRADFAAHLNSPGTFIDFGLAATDGSVKINREADRLVLFPYPRDKKFRVSLDMARLAPAANPQRVKVHVLAAGNCRDLGPAESRWERGRLTIDMGTAGAGRYVVEWPESANP